MSAEWQQEFLAFCFDREVPALFVEMRLVDENEANNATVSETATLTSWEKFEQDTKYLHDETNTKGELSTNVFYRLLTCKIGNRIKANLAKYKERRKENKREKMFRAKYEKARQREEIEMKEIKK
ncbi:hypothetical protein NDU88_004850 [Pleurodeles waltl]|uniref:Uncharacterized protein n=1 Tax=Pleurodeles waltl TaxID=8319 RepID=A0AAV7W9R0_PLEWA|nr:hypothetical protein NDU88_004850 [Pleurodeles waltl]